MSLKIEFLYFDKTACNRCRITRQNIEKTLKDLKGVLKGLDVKFELIEKKLSDKELKKSPTIRINSMDIEKIVNRNKQARTNSCTCCSKLANRKVNCRSYLYKNKEYDFIPKSMIRDAIKISLMRK